MTQFHLAGFAHDMRDASKIKDIYQKVPVLGIKLINFLAKSALLQLSWGHWDLNPENIKRDE